MKTSSLIASSLFVGSLLLPPFADSSISSPIGVAYANEAQDFELLKASQSGDLSAAKKAIAAGANVNAMSGNGISAIMYAAGKGHTDVVRFLLKSGANPNLAGTTNITPLMCAAMYGRHDVVQMLLAAGAKKNAADDKGNTAYTYAAKFPAIAQMLAPQTAPQAQPTNAAVDVDYQLIASAQAGNLAEVQKAIAAGANVNAMSGNGISAIMYAAGKGHTDVVRFLLKSGANPNLAGTTNITPLMTAAMFGRQDIAQMLLTAGAKKDAADDKGNTAYTYAAKFPAIAQMLAPQTAPQAQPTGLNPVQLYAKGLDNKDITLIKKAIASGLDVNGALDQEGWTALMFAAQDGLTEAIKTLVQAGAMLETKNNKGNTPLLLAALNGHSEAVKALIQAGAKLDATDKDGFTPLMVAAYNGHTETIKTLLQAGAKIDAKDNLGWTPLMLAASAGHTEVVKTLIQAGAMLETKNNKGNTPLLLAALNGHTETIKTLLQAGAKVDATDKNDWTALKGAASKGHTEAVKALIQAGAKLDATDKGGFTPLMVAAYNGHTETIKTLLQAGAKIDAKDNLGWTPLILAASAGHTEVVKTLIQAGANANEKNKDGYTALAYAKGSKSKNKEEIIALLAPLSMSPVQLFVNGVENKDIKLVEKAITNGLDVKGPLTQEGWTALMFAAQEGQVEAVKALIQAGAKLEATNKGGLTPLMIAAANDKFEAVVALVEAGADVNKMTKDYKSAYNFAKDKKVLGYLYSKSVPCTPLVEAVLIGDINSVKNLINSGVNVNASTEKQPPALLYAARYAYPEITKILLSAGAKVNTMDSYGSTPIHDVVTSNKIYSFPEHIETAKILIKAGANVNLRGKKRRPILIEAENPELVELLIKAGANVNDKWSPPIGSNIETPLSTAIEANNISKVKLLIRAGADVNCKIGRMSALRYATMMNEKEIAKLLKQAGAK